MRTICLFFKITGPFCGCPYKKSVPFGSVLRLLILENFYVLSTFVPLAKAMCSSVCTSSHDPQQGASIHPAMHKLLKSRARCMLVRTHRVPLAKTGCPTFVLVCNACGCMGRQTRQQRTASWHLDRARAALHRAASDPVTS